MLNFQTKTKIQTLLLLLYSLINSGISTELRCFQKEGNSSFDLELHFNELNTTAHLYSNLTVKHTSMQHFSASNAQFKPVCVDLSGNQLFVWPVFHCTSAIISDVFSRL